MSLQIKTSKSRGMPGAVGSVRASTLRAGMGGDPGLFGFIGDALGTVGRVAGSLLPGPIGGAVTGISNLIDPQEQQAPDLQLPRGTAPALPGLGGTVARLLPGGDTGYGYTAEQINNGKRRAGQRVPGTNKRWNKAPYTLKDGTYIPAGMKKVTIRKRNALNPRALDRALSRVTSAKRASKKLSRVTIRKAASCR